ncbi:MAG: DNA-binding protein H-NS [Roseibaca calidilacus]|uniref:DNA-binding protein H-NS n=1 Tax=Roseibaca calidilacus TaxID=1666912 RepID=A0A0N8K7U8_9RHOB|nr:H-NS histone family protein [Roseibaca calidilacus]KPP92737.1 MAG: DNA-binding protein H-NS [Roseibaca calidilacus]CUX80190.1 DNA-binding protein H-NS [Roseibaca calidilacus]
MVDLDTLSLSELKKLQKDVAKAIDTFEERELKAAAAEAEAVLRERGFSLAQVMQMGMTKPRAKVAPKYANPADPSQTWTGRGRKPRWVVDALAAGKTLTDLEI